MAFAIRTSFTAAASVRSPAQRPLIAANPFPRAIRRTLLPARRLLFCLVCLILGAAASLALAQAAAKPEPSREPGREPGQAQEIAIIVTATMPEAQAVVERLKAGMDFAVLAKEKSIDATAVDGGYMGHLKPDQLRPELRRALEGRKPGQLTNIVHLPSGYAVLKVLTAAPPAGNLNAKRMAALAAAGAIRWSASVAGNGEAQSALKDYPKPEGWNRDEHQVCRSLTGALANAKQLLRANLEAQPAVPGATSGARQAARQIQGYSALAQLYGYSGEMEQAVTAWKAAYRLAQAQAPGFMPNLEESLGATYLHWSEIENGAYTGSRDLDIFPPPHPAASYEKQEESRQAIQYFEKFLDRNPQDLEVKWLLNLSYRTLGEYPEGVPAKYLIPESVFHSRESVGQFVDLAPAAGLNVVRGAGGVIVDDFDGDGLLDVLVSSQNPCDPLSFFHNNGDGTFTDRSVQSGLATQLGGLNLVEADYNNDGCMDFLILRGGWEYPQPKSLMRNNCDGTFTDVTEAAGLGIDLTASQAAVWADIDNDGFVDLFVANENAPSQLFHNKGDGTFEEIGLAAGIDRTAFSKGVTAADYDHDGYMDFYVTNQGGVNYLYHNNGDWTFTEVGRQAGVQAPEYSFATWFFDYDNDGWPDLFVVSYMSSVSEPLKSYLGETVDVETLKLYRNKHDGTFQDVSAQVGLDRVFLPMGANFGDVDNDGFLDMYLGMGQPSFTSLMPHVLLRNDEGKSFTDITESSGTGEWHKGHGIAFADLARQGREDIVANMGGAVPSDRHALRVFANPGNANDWLNLRLVGAKTNRAAIGAEIHVTVTDGSGAPRSIYRTVGQTSSFGGNPMEQNIGLGPDAHAVTVDLWWPASGTRQHFADVGKNRYLEIKESAPGYTKLERRPFRLGGAAQSQTVPVKAVGKTGAP